MRTEQQGAPDEQLGQIAAERLRMLAVGLGLSPNFVADVQVRGQAAIIDRARLTDRTGAQARILTMCQQLGVFMEQRMASGRGVPMGVQMQAAEFISRKNGVAPELGLYLLGSVIETFQQASRRLAKESASDGGKSTRVRATAAGEPGVA